MYLKLQNGDKIKINNEKYTFININEFTLGHFERGIKCKILCEYLNNEELKNYYMNNLYI